MKMFHIRVSPALAAATALGLASQAGARKEEAPAAVSAAEAQTPGSVTAAFTDSSLAGLTGTKRVAITNVTIAFQASTGSSKEAKFFKPIMGRETVETVMSMPNMSQELQSALAEAAYEQLQAELTAQGYEIIPEAQVTASANYQSIMKQAGYANYSRFANASGDVMLVGPGALRPYASFSLEVGPGFFPKTSYLGWSTGFGGKSPTAGGPSISLTGNAWKVPGMEVALAKELNAHVVKAYYLVSLGSTQSKRSASWSSNEHSGIFIHKGDLYAGNYRTLDRTVTGRGTALAELGLVNDMSHISFRTPTGNPKWQKVSMMKPVPPKDGDVVVRLTSPIVGSTDYFNVVQANEKPKGLKALIGSPTQDIKFNFNATIIDTEGYGKEVFGMIAAANKAMLGLVKQ
jgi:hypothetical protein